MPLRSRFLGGVNASPPQAPPSKESPTPTESLKSDSIIILAVLFCAIICVLGLSIVVRCDWIRRITGGAVAALPNALTPANKGLKKKVLKSLPKLIYGEDERVEKLADCAICLAEFVAGEEVRVLPQCGHVFHVECVDTWLRSHSSCPSCRENLVVSRCQKCRNLPAATSSSSSYAAANFGALPQPASRPIDRFTMIFP
ncbi:RING-H2 finger ATL8-like [Olea europaea subsp. europaea]|uniref:RING-type E3 ubiquitin transferase n=1 Tax=Olea europaea subsp. europaea TaxID=158383 RepID=A0A8S0TPW8_OLEEU|nr:RING-H2 finger ATL8-like [Olea europaea subsp. europaea]